jgi:hypothetical protein
MGTCVVAYLRSALVDPLPNRRICRSHRIRCKVLTCRSSQQVSDLQTSVTTHTICSRRLAIDFPCMVFALSFRSTWRHGQVHWQRHFQGVVRHSISRHKVWRLGRPRRVYCITSSKLHLNELVKYRINCLINGENQPSAHLTPIKVASDQDLEQHLAEFTKAGNSRKAEPTLASCPSRTA